MATAVRQSVLDPQDYATSETVQILVGADRKKFSVHKDLIVRRSGFIERALQKEGLSDDESHTVTLAEDDPEAFGLIVNWLYTGRITTPNSGNAEIVQVKAYLMADKLQMFRCKNEIMDAIRLCQKDSFVSSTFLMKLRRFQNPSTSPLARYFIDQYAYDLDQKPADFLDDEKTHMKEGVANLFSYGGSLSTEIMLTLLTDRAKKGFVKDPSKMEGCVYHDHQRDSKKCAEEGEWI